MTTAKTKSKGKATKNKAKKPSATLRVYELVCANENITAKQLTKQLKKENLTMKDDTIVSYRSWVRQIIGILDRQGRLVR